jgi:serine protease inhibitor ecotin
MLVNHVTHPALLAALTLFTAVSATALHKVQPWDKIAVFSVADAGYQARVEAAIAQKQCYCLQHGYTFVLDVYTPHHGRTIHWSRITGRVALPC